MEQPNKQRCNFPLHREHNGEIPEWTNPLVVNFWATNVVIVLSLMAAIKMGVISKTWKLGTFLMAVVTTPIGSIVVEYARKWLSDGLQYIYDKHRWIVYGGMTYILQIASRMADAPLYRNVVSMLSSIFYIDETWQYYPVVEDLVGEDGRFKTNPKSDRYSTDGYACQIEKLKMKMKNYAAGSRERSDCVKKVRILHEMSTGNMSRKHELGVI